MSCPLLLILSYAWLCLLLKLSIEFSVQLLYFSTLRYLFLFVCFDGCYFLVKLIILFLYCFPNFVLLSAYGESITSSLPIWIHFIFYCLNAVARTSNTMLNLSGENGHTCLVPHFSWKAFSFSLLSIILAVGLS